MSISSCGHAECRLGGITRRCLMSRAPRFGWRLALRTGYQSQSFALAHTLDDEKAAVELSSRLARIFWYSGESYQRFNAAVSANSMMTIVFGGGPPSISSVA